MFSPDDSVPPFLTAKQLAILIGKSPRALAMDRFRGVGPPFVKWGRCVRYRREDVFAFLERNARQSTHEVSGT